MASVNKVIIVGHLGADPEVRSFQNGGQICNLRIATSESWKDKTSGERKERTEWHSVTITGDGLVSVAERYLRKGSKVYVEGQLRTRKWQDKDGADRYSTEVVLSGPGASMVMLDPPSGNGSNGGGERSQGRDQGQRDRGGYDDRGGGQRGGNDRSGDQQRGGGQQSRGAPAGGGWSDDLDDDIPF